MFIILTALLVTQSIILLLGDVGCDADVDDDDNDNDDDDDGDNDNDVVQLALNINSELDVSCKSRSRLSTQLSPSAICQTSLSSFSSIIIFASDIYLAISLSL